MINCGIDIGTNTVRMLIARVEDGRIEQVLHSERAITRLGAHIAETGMLSPEGVEKTLNLFAKFYNLIVKYKVENMFAAATSAVREAHNSEEFLEEARQIGIKVHIISGEDEAKYTYMGISSVVNLRSVDSAAIYDIGGGSTELSLIRNGEQVFSSSTPVGVIKLSDKFGFSGVNTKAMQNDCANYIKQVMSDAFIKIRSIEPKNTYTAIGTAGTVTTIAAYDLKMNVYDPFRVNGHKLSQIRLEDMLTDLSGLTTSEILALDGIEKGREDLMVPGIILMLQILRGISTDESAISDSGLREGLTIAAIS